MSSECTLILSLTASTAVGNISANSTKKWRLEMNEAPNNTSGLNDTFSSQPAPQSNPFTADLKGEFTSNFGTNTNAVSQIFKEGGFVNQDRTKKLIIGGAVIVVLAVAIYLFTSGGEEEGTEVAEETSGEEAGTEEGTTEEAAGEETAEEGAAEEGQEETAEETQATPTEQTTAATDAGAGTSVASNYVPSSFSASSGALTLMEPADGSSLSYDESQGAANFSWSGGGGWIVFSRNASMNPVSLKVAVSGNSYAFNHPWPGKWYWKVQNKSGSTEVRSFSVGSPVRRNVQISEPQAGGSVAGNGGTISWQGDSKVAYYRVEFSTGDWANPPYKFSSSGNSVQTNGVPPGQYMMRVGAFSEVSGRWEYTAPVSVSVQ